MYVLVESIVKTILYVGDHPNRPLLREVGRNTKMEYGCIRSSFQLLVKSDVLKAKKINGVYDISLTDKGRKIYEALRIIRKEFKYLEIERWYHVQT